MVVWLVLAEPFHSAPGVEEFHTNPEFHVNGSGMGSILPDWTHFWQCFFGGGWLTTVKMATAARMCFNVRDASLCQSQYPRSLHHVSG